MARLASLFFDRMAHLLETQFGNPSPRSARRRSVGHYRPMAEQLEIRLML